MKQEERKERYRRRGKRETGEEEREKQEKRKERYRRRGKEDLIKELVVKRTKLRLLC